MGANLNPPLSWALCHDRMYVHYMTDKPVRSLQTGLPSRVTSNVQCAHLCAVVELGQLTMSIVSVHACTANMPPPSCISPPQFVSYCIPPSPFPPSTSFLSSFLRLLFPSLSLLPSLPSVPRCITRPNYSGWMCWWHFQSSKSRIHSRLYSIPLCQICLQIDTSPLIMLW